MIHYAGRPTTNVSAKSSDKLRLMLLIVGLAVTCCLMTAVRKPANWRVLFGHDPANATAPQNAPVSSALKPTLEPPSPTSTLSERKASDLPIDLLKEVRDDTFQLMEIRSWNAVWNRIASTPADELKRNSWGNVAYAQLMHQPEIYRGRIVSVQGTARRARKIVSPTGNLNFPDYWELWIDPTWGPAAPIVVCCAELPSDFPTGDTIRCPIRCEGYFYKRWAYKAQDGVRTAPVLLAKTLHTSMPKPVATPPAPVRVTSGPWLFLASITCLLGVGSAYLAFGKRSGSRTRVSFRPANSIASQADPSATERAP